MANEPEFTALRDRPEFKALVARLQREAALWKDSPALATPFKPVLGEEEKVAGLSKIWSEARFNFPFFGRIDVDWDAEYMAFLPQVRAAKTTEDYYRVLARFVAILRDGHTRLVAPRELNDRLYAVAPLTTRLVEGKVIITEVEDQELAAQGIVPGTELVAIDGRPVLEYAKAEIEPYVFGFTPQDRAAWIYGIELLRGPLDKPLNLSFRLAEGGAISSVVRRRTNRGGYFPETPIPAEFKMLPGNIAYLRVQEFVDDAAVITLRENIATVSKSNGLIIDIRLNGGGRDREHVGRTGHPGEPAIPRIELAIARLHRGGALMAPDPRLEAGYLRQTAVRLRDALHRPRRRADEWHDLFLRGAIRHGNPDHEARHHRGRSHGRQREQSGGLPAPRRRHRLHRLEEQLLPRRQLFNGIGIMPDVPVSPTIADVRAGRDRALEKAVEMLKVKH